MIKYIHSYWAYIVLVILIFAVVNATIGFTQKKKFTDKDLRIGLFTLIVAHIQLLIGLGWYFMSPWFKVLKDSSGEVMDKATGLLVAEYPIMITLAIVLITIGWSKHKKKTTDIAKFKTVAIFYGIALLLILSETPWSN